MPEWAEETVQQLQDRGVLFVEDGNHGEYRPLAHEFVSQGVPFVRPPDLVGGKVDFSSCDQINQTALARVRKGIGRGGDVLFTHRATVGRLAIMPSDAPMFVCNPGVTVWRSLKPDVLDRRFLYYSMHAAPFMDQVWALAGGADTFPYIGLIQQRTLRVALPSIQVQRAISAVLGALDDKIELNRRMNRTLEAMARALFRSWFVDFDPVRAKAEGRAPAHMDPATAALFPARFGEDGLPEGWRPGRLGEVAESPRRGLDPAAVSPTTPYIGLEHMPRRCIALSEWGEAGDVGSAKSKMHVGEFLFGKLRPYFHKVGIVPVDGICSTDIVVVRPKSPLWAGFTLCVISSDTFVEHTDASSAGTKMPRTSWGDMARFEIAVPPAALAGAFDEITTPWRRAILASIHQSRTLAALRDTLLPKLMSGELRVCDAERAIAEVA